MPLDGGQFLLAAVVGRWHSLVERYTLRADTIQRIASDIGLNTGAQDPGVVSVKGGTICFILN